MRNLRVDPGVTVEVGTETYAATAVELAEPERSAIFSRQVAAMPGFAEYQEKAGDRVIPVVAIERTS